MWASDLLDLTNLDRMRQEANELAAQLSAGAAAASGQFAGRDDSGAVEIIVDGEGVPTRVHLDWSWRQIIGLSGLGPAIVAALANATMARLAAWAEGCATYQAHGGPAPDVNVPTDHHCDIGDPSSRQSVLALRDLLNLVSDVTAQLPQLIRAAEAVGTQPVTSTNPTCTVRVTATGGMINAVEFDAQWLRSAQPDRIGAAVRDALTASARADAAARDAIFDAAPGLHRLRRVTASPETLLREIGLLS